MSSKSVIVIGGGLAGLSSAVALADAGFRVRLLEQRPFLGGRASSYALPGGEHVDNCQHVTLGCCTNLDDFYRRVGAAGKIAFYDRLVFVDRRGPPRASCRPPRCRRRCIWRRPRAFIPRSAGPSATPSATPCWPSPVAAGATPAATPPAKACSIGCASTASPNAAIRRFWGVVLVSALNDELDRIDARYGLDVFWKAFLANRAGYLLGIPRVPLGELYDGCRAAIERRGGEVVLRAPVRRSAHRRRPRRRRGNGRRLRRRPPTIYRRWPFRKTPCSNSCRRSSSSASQSSPISATCASRPSPACISGSTAT